MSRRDTRSWSRLVLRWSVLPELYVMLGRVDRLPPAPGPGDLVDCDGGEVILATHDRDILAGIVNTSTPSVVRLVRESDNSTQAYQLKSKDLDEIWADSVLKYSQMLDGLFHQVAVLAEAERDCRFYEAALDFHGPLVSCEEDLGGLPPTEVLFIPTLGTSNMPKLARVLQSLKVPVIVRADLDVLDNESVIKNIVEALRGSWQECADDWRSVTAPLSSAPAVQLAATVYETIAAEFDSLLAADPRAKYDGETRKRINAALRPTSWPWDEVKHHGLPELLRVNKHNTESVRRLLSGLENQNVLGVAAGELESFGHELGIEKGKNWLPAALKSGLHKQPAVQAHAKKLLTNAARLTSPLALHAPQP